MAAKFWLVGTTFALLACKGDPKPAVTPPEPAAAQVDAAPLAEDAAPPVTKLPDAAAATPDAPPAMGDAAATEDGAAAGAPHDAAVVKLIEAGAEPRTAMRYTAAVGVEQLASLHMTTELELGATGQKMPTELPKTRMVIGAKVTAVDPSAGTSFGLTITEADLADGAKPGGTRAGEKLAEVIRGMKGLRGDKLASARGVSQRFTLAAPEGSEGIMATAALKPVVQGFERAIDQMTVPFPEEAIGVGAKWEVTQKVVEAGMTLDQVTSFEVSAVKGAIVSLRFTVVLKAPAGKLESTFAGGMVAQVTKLSGSGEGSIEVDLGRVLPMRMSAKNSITMGLELDAPDQKRTLEVEMRVALEVTSP